MPLDPLPIDAVLPQVIDAARAHPSVVLQAPTGAGKTTRVPPALLDAGVAGSRRIVLLEPRRLAARAAARRMAQERGQDVGGDVGYHVRFDRCIGPSTRVVVMTEGILLRQLLDDPFLESTGILIFDEFHERSVDSDLALGMVRLVQQTVRPELRIVVMSATLAGEAVAAYLGGCPVVQSEGRLFPVEIRYEPRPHHQPAAVAATQAIERLLDQTPGDVLVFLPGWHEIRHSARLLEPLAAARDLAVVPLHGDLVPEHQDAALLRGPRRRIVLATNVAETSVTVEGITAVVDTGLARQLTIDPRLGLDRLQVTPISQASAAQRAGRAGRLQPGICVRLWSEANHRQRPEHTAPEIRRIDLAGPMLHLACLGEAELTSFPWLEAPRPESVQQALALLRRLGALAGAAPTELGRLMARLPVHPRLGRMLIEGHRRGDVARAALAAALLSEHDPFPAGASEPVDPLASSCNLFDRIEALEAFEHQGRSHQGRSVAGLHRVAAKSLLRVRDQYRRELRGAVRGGQESAPAVADRDSALPRALLAGFPERVVRRREGDSRRGVMVGGRGVRVATQRGLADGELFLAVDVEDRPQEALVRRAVALKREWLPAEMLSDTIEVIFDDAGERVIARRRLRYLDLLLEESPAAPTDADEVSRTLCAAASGKLDRVLPAADSPAGRFLVRVRCLGEWMPELKLPAFDERQLRELLPWLCAGRRSFAELRDGPWLDLLAGALTPQQRHALEREAPDRIEVPSGSRIALHYEAGKAPVLAVRIQEVFGWRDTPRLAGGRVTVLLHLLAPSQRPQQVTDDLASFWKNTYPRIRKELRARYPKHAWPEDPLTAPPQRRPGRRG
ncbi:MAG: ATP-dependent helicase HrpB [Gemmataceae bacterium]|nr:ATP-dependent helicase HrpB [Gemmataceae bacterium]